MERLPLIPKRRTFGEISLTAIFLALAVATAFIASRAYTPPTLPHGAVSLGSVLAVVESSCATTPGRSRRRL